MTTDENLSVYEQPNIVQDYVQSQRLTQGELVILQQHESLFRGKRILDIGVGGGRTTPALARLASSYAGVDYSAAMVASCSARFAGQPGIQFLQDDARTLAQFPDAAFDAAVFSFNGIDCVAMEDRPAVFAAVRRVLAPNGTFVFSFHNSHYLPHLYRPHWSRNPFKWPGNYRHYKKLVAINGPQSKYTGLDYFRLLDGAEDYRLQIAYLRPVWQVEQVRGAGFEVLNMIASEDGRAISNVALETTDTPWIYLVCRKG